MVQLSINLLGMTVQMAVVVKMNNDGGGRLGRENKNAVAECADAAYTTKQRQALSCLPA
jgi:hypothetical protein